MKIVKLLDGVSANGDGDVYESRFLRDNEVGLVQAVYGGDRTGTTLTLPASPLLTQRL